MVTDVNIKPNSTRPKATAKTEIQPASTTDDTSHFNLSNPTPTAETTTKTKTPTSYIIDRCLPKNQTQPWYNPVCTEKDTSLTTAQRLLQHYRENDENTDDSNEDPTATHKLTTAYYRKPHIVLSWAPTKTHIEVSLPVITKEKSFTDNITTKITLLLQRMFLTTNSENYITATTTTETIHGITKFVRKRTPSILLKKNLPYLQQHPNLNTMQLARKKKHRVEGKHQR